MKILFDANVPAPLSKWLRDHQVVQAVELGWDRLKNGALLQNFTNRQIALVVLSTNHWLTLRPVAARIAAKLDFVGRGQVIRIDVADV